MIIKSLVKTILLLTVMVAFSSCKKGDGFAPFESIAVGEGFELAYGSTPTDRLAFEARRTGSSPPTFADVLTRWRRFSGTFYYPTLASIVADPANCYTTMDGNGSWSNITVAPNIGQSPNTHTSCNTPSMNSLSWVFLNGPDRLHNIQNTNNYNGFFSAIKFDHYIAEATLSSTNADDDAIGVTIAVYVDGSSNIHTLTAYRTGGGVAPNLGWGLVHKTNNTIVRVIGNKSVGGGGGWNSRNSKIRIERTGDVIRAYASVWTAGATPLDIDPASLIEINLADPAENLLDFRGPQSFGYETRSQPNASFSLLNFTTPQTNSDPDFIYDLHTNRVYSKNPSGIGYLLVNGASAMQVLGSPRKIINLETQREFNITSATTFEEVL